MNIKSVQSRGYDKISGDRESQDYNTIFVNHQSKGYNTMLGDYKSEQDFVLKGSKMSLYNIFVTLYYREVTIIACHIL